MDTLRRTGCRIGRATIRMQAGTASSTRRTAAPTSQPSQWIASSTRATPRLTRVFPLRGSPPRGFASSPSIPEQPRTRRSADRQGACQKVARKRVKRLQVLANSLFLFRTSVYLIRHQEIDSSILLLLYVVNHNEWRSSASKPWDSSRSSGPANEFRGLCHIK